jgi:hypothetical protein
MALESSFCNEAVKKALFLQYDKENGSRYLMNVNF